ncbi:hypothetical protein OPT61_g1549 [Boeremia exigua]|uniref:Uncharacterized protein n=1 Tax=Boeremia exigua TaxID=749465 RepID=A0ACC2IPX2_9PLEO|nr:hypothetical protein OPT61_g1549 [Boeremia exigua]
MERSKSFLWDPKSLEDDVFIRSPGEPKTKVEDLHAYASFGDSGTTASVNAYGHLMQISQYLGVGSSGFFCVELEGCPQSYAVKSRMDYLWRLSNESDKGIRLDVVDWTKFRRLPVLGFMYDRWPRYVYTSETPDRPEQKGDPKLGEEIDDPPSDSLYTQKEREVHNGDPAETSDMPQEEVHPLTAFPLSIQYFCSRGSVIQKYLFRAGQLSPQKVPVARGITIRTLDFVNYSTFNEPYRHHGPGLETEHESDDNSNENPGDESQNDHGVCDGSIGAHPDTLEPTSDSNIESDERLDIRSAVRQVCVEDDVEQHTEQNVQQNVEQDVGHTAETNDEHYDKIEVDKNEVDDGYRKRAYRAKTFVVAGHNLIIARSLPWAVIQQNSVRQIGVERPVAVALVISAFINDRPAQIESDWYMTIGDNVQMSDIEITFTYKLQLLDQNQMEAIRIPGLANLTREAILKARNTNISEDRYDQDNQSSTPATISKTPSSTDSDHPTSCACEVSQAIADMGRVFRKDNTFRKICFSRDPALDFVFRRNLEHMLSVCSIPIGDRAIAIGCGDISGHRIGPRASLSAVQFLRSMYTYLHKSDEGSDLLHYNNRNAYLKALKTLYSDTKANTTPQHPGSAEPFRSAEEQENTEREQLEAISRRIISVLIANGAKRNRDVTEQGRERHRFQRDLKEFVVLTPSLADRIWDRAN